MSGIGGQSLADKVSRNKRRVGLSLLLAVLCLFPFLVRAEYYVHLLILIFVYVIYASTYRFVLRTGQLHFGAHGFIGAGAFASVLMVTRLGLPFWVSLPLAGGVAALLAVAIGYPALRIKGAYFAIITWGFAESLRFLYMRMDNPFGGNTGLSDIPRPNPIPLPFVGSIDFHQQIPCYFLALILVVITISVLYRLEKSRYGLIYSAIREADTLAKAVGINIMRYKVLAFAVCSGLAGLGGAFYAHYSGFISPASFVVLLTISLGMYCVVGGLDSLTGPIVGTAVLVLAGEYFAQYGFYKIMLYAGLMVLTILLLPGGIVGLPATLSSGVAKLRARRRAGVEYDSP